MSSPTGPPPPPLSSQDRAAAAARGVHARQVRAQVRTGLGEGSIDIRDVLRAGHADDEYGRILARMKVVDLLSSFRGIGPIRAADMMADIGIAANRRVGGLGYRQVQDLTEAIDSRYSGRRP